MLFFWFCWEIFWGILFPSDACYISTGGPAPFMGSAWQVIRSFSFQCRLCGSSKRAWAAMITPLTGKQDNLKETRLTQETAKTEKKLQVL